MSSAPEELALGILQEQAGLLAVGTERLVAEEHGLLAPEGYSQQKALHVAKEDESVLPMPEFHPYLLPGPLSLY